MAAARVVLGLSALAVVAVIVPPRHDARAEGPAGVSVVTMDAAPGDGGNAWGGHQTRVVRTVDGVSTLYTVEGSGPLARRWRLVRLTGADTWTVEAEGDAGREPPNLLAEPDGTLDVVAFPDGVGTLWRGRPAAGRPMTTATIPGLTVGNWPYNAAGIDRTGRLCVVATNGGEVGGTLEVACRTRRGVWTTRATATDFRYAYDYVFPAGGSGLTVVGTRDVLWSALGLDRPEGAFDYAFTAAGTFTTANAARPLRRIDLVEEPATAEHPAPYLDAQMDAYVDTSGRIHVLYWRRGGSTGGVDQLRHRVLSATGRLIDDVELPDLGWYQRILQDDRGRFFLVGSSGWLQRMGRDGLRPIGAPRRIDLGGHPVEYSGMAISAPRTGTRRSGVVDLVWPSDDERGWIYAEVTL